MKYSSSNFKAKYEDLYCNRGHDSDSECLGCVCAAVHLSCAWNAVKLRVRVPGSSDGYRMT